MGVEQAQCVGGAGGDYDERPTQARRPPGGGGGAPSRGDDGGIDARDARSLIAGVLSPDRCYCEHDCCGHRHGWADVDFLTMDTARVVVRTARNY